MKESPVEQWFGPRFAELHPLLQALHQQGGTLHGKAEVGVGRGLAGWLGRRVARRMGLPIVPEVDLAVIISHDGRRLRWARVFGSGSKAVERVSWFEPHGLWPHGHWEEQTGALRFMLTVDVEQGAWQWRLLGARWHGVPVPVRLLPRSRAGKRIVDGDYEFAVEVIAPVLGPLLWYRGRLRPAASPAGSPRPGSGAAGSAG